jgi:peptidoglycan hydrolase-like protein with peptidoglycan-binding domain
VSPDPDDTVLDDAAPDDTVPDFTTTHGGATDGGILADIDNGPRRALPVAPSVAQEYNTVRPPLRAVAAWRMDDHRFDFGSSFPRPSSAAEFKLLARRRPPDTGELSLTVFGHADPVGQDDYNQVLAGRRARAVYAILVRDADTWDQLHGAPHGDDQWGTRHHQIMLNAAGHDAGAVDGKLGPRTQQAVRSFQQSQGLPASGFLDGASRRALFLAYMDALCVDDRGRPFRYAREDFLGRGAGQGGKADYQSCSEYNPVLVFSQAEDQRFKAPALRDERNRENSPNRRVVVLMFPRAPVIPPERWPCPTTKEGGAKCRALFWPDGDARRSPQERRREQLRSGRTFACRFYDWLAGDTLAEAVRGTVRIWLLDQDGQRMGADPASADPNRHRSGAPYRLVLAPGQVRVGLANAEGRLEEVDVAARHYCTIQWGRRDDAPRDEPPHDDETAALYYLFEGRIFLDTGRGDVEVLVRKLGNLGYTGTEAERRGAFAEHYGSAEDVEIEDVHATGRPRPA